jgi:hypothetical protein
VLLERSRTAEVAQRAHPVRADGPDTRMLGDVVAHTFGLRGQEYTDAEWDSWKGEDGKWVVALSWRAGRSDNRAHWTFQPGAHGGTVTAVDEHASDLIEGLPARPLRTVGPVIDIARPEDPAPAPGPEQELRAVASDSVRGSRIDPPPAAEARTVERTPTRTAPEPRRPATPAQRQPSAEPQRAEPAREAARAEPVHPEPAREAVRTEPTRTQPARTEPSRPERTRTEPAAAEAGNRRQPAAQDDAPAPASTPEPAEPAKPEAAEPVTVTAARKAEPPRAEKAASAPEPAVAAPAPEEPAEAPAPEPAAAKEPAGPKRTKKGKPVMPSWDEVLLGVRGQR